MQARKQCGPFRRHVLPVAMTVCAVFAGYSANALRAGEFNPPPPNPRNPVNYVEWLNKYVSQGVTENAYETYMKAFARLTEYPEPEWVDDLAINHAWLDENREAMELFRKATQMKDFAYRWDLPGGTGDERLDYMVGSVQIHWLRSWRDAYSGLIAEGWRSMAAGDQDGFVDNVLAGLRGSHHMYRSLLLFPRLRATADAKTAYRSLATAFSVSGDRDGLAAILAPRLTQDDPPIPGVRLQFMMEKMGAWDMAQRLFVPDEQKPGELTLYHPMLQWFADRGAAPFSPMAQLAQTKIGFDSTIESISNFYNHMADWAEKPYHQTKPGDREAEVRAAFDKYRTQKPSPLGMMVLVPLVHPRDMNTQITATRRGTHLVVHLFDHRRQNGAFPGSLAELKVSNLKQLRIDPFSGKDFRYNSDGKTFTLYSLGDDLDDDGGSHSLWEEDGDFVFWPTAPAK